VDDRAVKGIPWTMLSYAANRVVSVATTILLARLLVPADFGLFALALLGTGFISQFSGFGLGTTLVLRQDLDRRGQGTILSLLLLTGVAFAALLAALTPLAAALFEEPRLVDVLLVMAGILSFTGVNWFYDSLLQRELAFRRRFVTQMISTVAFSAVALVFALQDAGVWALVAAHISMHASKGIALLCLAPYRVRPAFDRRVARDALSTGGGFVLQDAAAYLQQNADYIVIGRVLPTSQLGYYSMAYRQAELPHYAIADPVARVTFPSFAGMRHRGEDVMPAFLSGLRLVALATCPLAVILSAAADPFTRALFGDAWLPMIGVLSVLGVWAVARPLEVTVAWLLNSIGAARRVGLISVAMLAPFVAGLFIASSSGGITAVAWVLLGHMVVLLTTLVVTVQRVTGVSVARQWAALRPLFLASAVSWAATRWACGTLESSPPALTLAVACAIALTVYLGAIRLLQPTLLAQALGQLRRAVGRPGAQAAVASPT
jgi:O-antigen/teichoic acid export membrane protein